MITSNGNGTQAVIELDAKTLLAEQTQQETATQRKKREKEEREAKKKAEQEAKRTAILNDEPVVKPATEYEELDYAPVDSINQAMLIMSGVRIEHDQPIKGLCAIGEVHLQIGSERIKFGVMTEKNLQIDMQAQAFLYECEFSSEEILAIREDAQKAWCLEYKVQKALDKATRDKSKKQSKVDKQKAILAKIKGAK